MRLLWTVASDRAPIHIFGGGPPTTVRWHDPAIEALVAVADVFWNEVPEMASDDYALAARFGIDSAKPLPTWLSASDLARVEAAASAVGVHSELLRPLRPWLCAQVLKQAAQSAAGLVAENAGEVVLADRAKRANVTVRSESPTPEAIFTFFSSLERAAEVALLLLTLDEIEAGPHRMVLEAQAVTAGDASVGERLVERIRTLYMPLYNPLLVTRNRRWVERIARMRQRTERGFIYVGSAHLAGPHAIQAMLTAEGVAVGNTI